MEEKINILIVDDDLNLAKAIKLVLEAEGYYLETAGDGANALELIKQREFDILLVDYNLPDMNGFDLVKKIREISRDFMFVIITGESSMSLVFEGMHLKAYDFLVKPIDYDGLKRIIKEIIEKRKRPEEDKEKPQEIAEEEVTPAEPVEEAVTPVEPPTEIKEEKITSVPSLPDEEKEKTIFDFILDRSVEIKRIIRNFIVFAFAFTILFIAIDILYLQLTKLGKSLHNKIWPPAIILDSIPSGAQVSLKDENGMEVLTGKPLTPVSIPKILPGSYSLKMSVDIYNPIERKITIYSEEKKIKDVFISGSVKRDAGKEKTQKFVIPFELTVRIESEPAGAIVYIDEKKMGIETPMEVDLTAGLHTVMLEKEGFPALGNLERLDTYGQCNLDLTKQKQDSIDTRCWEATALEKGICLKGSFWKEIRIDSKPPGAKFLIDGELIGVTPANLKLTVGLHKLRVEKVGFYDWNKTLRVPGDERIIAYLLKRVRFIAYDEDNPGRDLGAEVRINKKQIKGKHTPFCYSFKHATSYEISFVKPPDFITWTKKIKIEDQDEIIANMQRERFPVEIKVIEAESRQPISTATILVDGKVEGETDVNGSWLGSIKSGEHLIEVRKEMLILTIPYLYTKSVKKYLSAGLGEIEIYLGFEDGMPIEEEVTQIKEEKPLPSKQEKEKRKKEKRKKEKRKKKKRKEEKQTSILIIDTRPHFPKAGIFLDGKLEGETIRRIPDVPLGRHKITIKHPYIGSVSSEIEVDRPGGKIIINFNNNGEVEIK